ncbi:MAG TPA: ATP-binding protein [Candidatus Omnitrophota bacterium]|nr:ATP-binding protein [Candidatus Omnitrophota bacterium]HNQ50398.1 ATP-binding protein [Candidatus Omnitrophota bacterium]
MIISVASGKGGTGKTTIAVNLALSLKDIQLLDCDVEEPNAHLFVKPRITDKAQAFIPVPEVDEAKCVHCGICREVCAYHAIAVLPASKDKKGSVLIFPHLCHGCGACSLLCPQKAVKEVNKEIGAVERGAHADLQFVHGRLNIGEAMSPPLIRQVKNYIDPARTTIIDAPPGTSCPVITAVKASDYCILVTEPTPFGLNDLVLAVEVVRTLGILFGVVINRADIGDGKVEEYCSREHIPVLMKIPFSRDIAKSYSEGVPLVKMDASWKKKFVELYGAICALKK